MATQSSGASRSVFFVVRVCADKANRHTVRWELERAATKRKEIHCSVRQTKNHNVWVDFVVDRRFSIECHTFLCVSTVFQIFAFRTLLTINYRLCQSTRQKNVRSFFILWLLPKEAQRLENHNPLSMCVQYSLVRNFILLPFHRLLWEWNGEREKNEESAHYKMKRCTFGKCRWPLTNMKHIIRRWNPFRHQFDWKVSI